jgi:hypothetical protein
MHHLAGLHAKLIGMSLESFACLLTEITLTSQIYKNIFSNEYPLEGCTPSKSVSLTAGRTLFSIIIRNLRPGEDAGNVEIPGWVFKERRRQRPGVWEIEDRVTRCGYGYKSDGPDND